MAFPTITIPDGVGAQPSAPTFVDRISFAGDASYPTGGTAGFKAALQAITKDLRQPVAVVVQDSGGAYELGYDETNDKLKVFSIQTHAEVANTTNLSGTTFIAVVFSK